MTVNEEWQNLTHRPGGYAVSSFGSVRRNPYIDKRGWNRQETYLTPFYRGAKKSPGNSKIGYVRLAGGQGCSNVAIPQLVAEAFLPYQKAFHEVQFADGDPSNWKLSNLTLRSRMGAKLERRLTRILNPQAEVSGDNYAR
jgi:hypothetical protein